MKNQYRTIDQVKKFWNSNPLLSGEIQCKLGSRKWFEEFDAIKTNDVFLGDLSRWMPAELAGKKALDVGCGPGYWMRQLEKINLDYYGFDISELKDVMEDGFLPNDDPKFLLAKQNLDTVDVNESSLDDLLRVPGIGPITAKRIVGLRGKKKIRNYRELKNMGVVLKRAKPFLEVNGKQQKRLGDFV